MSTMKRARSNWTAREDAILRELVHKASSHPILWRELAKSIPGRSDKECRKRWWNNLVGSSTSRCSSVPVEEEGEEKEEEEEDPFKGSNRLMSKDVMDGNGSATIVSTMSADKPLMRYGSISSSEISYDDVRTKEDRSPASTQQDHNIFEEERASADTAISSTRKRRRTHGTRAQARTGDGVAGNDQNGPEGTREADVAHQYQSLPWGRKEDTNGQKANPAFSKAMKDSSYNSRTLPGLVASSTKEPTEQQQFWLGQNGTASPPNQSDCGGQNWMNEMMEQIMNDQSVPSLCFDDAMLDSTPCNSDWDPNMAFEIQDIDMASTPERLQQLTCSAHELLGFQSPVAEYPVPPLDPLIQMDAKTPGNGSCTQQTPSNTNVLDSGLYRLSIDVSCTPDQLSNIMTRLASTGSAVNVKIDTC